MKRFSVIGNPVSHSLSPQIHNLFASEQGIDIEYIKIESSVNTFKNDVEEFFKNGGIGMNVTLPFKEMAFTLSDESDEFSKKCQSCNTLFNKNGKVFSYSTDGLGFLRDLSNNKIDLENKSILVLGAGGSAKSIIEIFDNSKIQSNIISIYNRTTSKVDDILHRYTHNLNITKHENESCYDLIINCTSLNMNNDVVNLPSNIFNNDSVAYDLFYSSGKTKFEDWAKCHGAYKTINGIGMLIEQAALSYNIWNNHMPSTSGIKTKLGYESK